MTTPPAWEAPAGRPALTEEQARVVASRSARLVVVAGAGTGKTSTLCEYARVRPARRLLYVAFNKAIQLEAAARMPANVSCRTTHSLAFGMARDLFGAAAFGKVGNTYASAIARALDCSVLEALGAQQAVQRWCASLEGRIGSEHLPADIAARLAEPEGLLGAARALWQRMLDPAQGDILLPHDGYLKLFQLERPRLPGCDLVMVDEAQDLNVCTFDIVARQPGGQVLVGDPAQAIYGFRGAVDALGRPDAEERLSLTRSFRFGDGIAQVANALLGHFRPGSPPVVGAGSQRTTFAVDGRAPFAVLARTHAGVFEEAVRLLKARRRLHFVGGPEGYKLDKILDAYRLWRGERAMMRDAYLRSFASFDELVSLACEALDPELRQLVRVVLERRGQIPGLVEAIKARHAECPKAAWPRFEGVFLATAHKAKGLEFEQVWLADDYVALLQDGRALGPGEVDAQEVHILYVALTRARRAIRLCEPLREWLEERRIAVGA